MVHPRLFEPVRVGRLTLQSRIAIPAHGPRLSGARYLRYLEERVKHGLGLLIVSVHAFSNTSIFSVGPRNPIPAHYLGDADVRWPDPGTPQGARHLDEVLIPAMRQLAELAHRHGAVCFGQVGQQGSYTTSPDWYPGLSPSGLPDEMLGETSHRLSEREIAKLVSLYGPAATRIREAGMDGIEVHACHGHLLNAFLSPRSNRRDDAYGGSPEGRARILLEILAEIRKAVGSDLVVGVRLPGDDFLEGDVSAGLMAETARLAAPLLDYVNVAGPSEGGRQGGVTAPAVPSADWPQALYADASRAIREATGLPVLLTGRITDPEVAESLVAEGKADLVGMVRALIADPEWVRKVRDGEIDDLRRCTGDNEGCRQRTLFRSRGGGMAIGCTVNAAAGREEEMEIRPAPAPRRVLVVGGGPAGMEAARVASLRGHHVILCERGSQLGGQVLVATQDPRGAGLAESVRHLARQLAKLGVEVRLGVEVTPAEVERIAPEFIVVATGARPATPPPLVPGGSPAVDAGQVLSGAVELGHRVCLVAGFDGHRAPLTLAELLADRGHEVSIITERALVGEGLDPGTNHLLLRRLLEKAVALHPLTGLAEIRPEGLLVYNSLTRRQSLIAGIDTVVTVERAPEDALYRALEGRWEAVAAGDCIAPRRVLHAVLEGARAGLVA